MNFQSIILRDCKKLFTPDRYGLHWADWHSINDVAPNTTSEVTLDLSLSGNRAITAVSGVSDNKEGDTYSLEIKTSDGATWGPHGDHKQVLGRSERPSPSSPLVLSHLSGDETLSAHIIRFHWRPVPVGGIY